MKKKLTDKDKKDWQNFLKSKEPLEKKDLDNKNVSSSLFEKTIDLHGYTLDEANIAIFGFIKKCYSQKIMKINVITGKGLRSKNVNDPYKSNKLGILKYSVPNFIKNNSELMNKILKIEFESVNSPSKGSFNIILRKSK